MSLTALLSLVAFLLPLGFAFWAAPSGGVFVVASWLAVGGVLGAWGFAVIILFALWSHRLATGPSGSTSAVRWTLSLLGVTHLVVVWLLAAWAGRIMRQLAHLPPGAIFANALTIVFPYVLLMSALYILKLAPEGVGWRRSVRLAFGRGMLALALLLLFTQFLGLRAGTLIVSGRP